MAGHNVLHVHISMSGRQLDRVEAVDHTFIPSCEESQFILCDDGSGGLQGFWVAKATVLLAMLGAEAVRGRGAGVAGGHHINQVFVIIR